jgi:hypothetical protein
MPSLLFAAMSANVALAQSTAFTYQGRLEEAGVPANGAYDIRFRLFNDDLAGVQFGSTLCRDDVDVVNGLFSVELDFGHPLKAEHKETTHGDIQRNLQSIGGHRRP